MKQGWLAPADEGNTAMISDEAVELAFERAQLYIVSLCSRHTHLALNRKRIMQVFCTIIWRFPETPVKSQKLVSQYQYSILLIPVLIRYFASQYPAVMIFKSYA